MMSIKVVLFDLDGTLLPMDQDLFVKAYFGALAKKLAPYGYEAEKLVGAIWTGTKAMVMNTGETNNEEAFWKKFSEIYGEEVREHIPVFDEFYRNEFISAKEVCGFNSKASEIINMLKDKGVRVSLATNPIFPAIATENRIAWAGLKPEDFEIYTTYENSSFCKPNPKYYLEITEKLGVKPEECIMIGNDVSEDMVSEKLGMKVFLLTDCLINKEDKDISQYPNGDFDKLKEFLVAEIWNGGMWTN